MKIITSVVFPRALPLRLGESTFTVPPPIPKTAQKRALCKLYIYRKGEAFLAPFCVLFPSVEKRPPKSEAFRRVPQSSSSGSLCDLLILNAPRCCSTRVTLNAKSRTTAGGVQDEEITQGSGRGTLWDSTKCLRLCADVFPQTEKGRKKEPKRPPLFYIYIACKGLFFERF